MIITHSIFIFAAKPLTLPKLNKPITYMFIKKLFTFASLFAFTASVAAINRGNILSVSELSPSGTLPVLHIDTENAQVIDQKETYINGSYWLDAADCDGIESLGSEAEPLSLGIRGRGNASWVNFDKKPYKLKLDKKQELMGLPKNKHFALLHYIGGTTSYFGEVMGFEIARHLGMDWVPTVKPVEVMLNGDYIGLYFLAETVRVDENRVNITEQPDNSTDPAEINSGWLVEIDNYAEENQLTFDEPSATILRLTYKTPEVLSQEQEEFLTDQFQHIIDAVYNDDKSSTEWEGLIETDPLVKAYIVQEILHNYDAFNGSFYFHKDTDTKWIAGPLWDLNASLDKYIDTWLFEDLPSYSKPKLVPELCKYPRFMARVRAIWQELYADGFDYVREFANAWNEQIKEASKVDKLRWPDYGRENTPDILDRAWGTIIHNIEWLNEHWGEGTGLTDITAPSSNGDHLQVHTLSGIKIYDGTADGFKASAPGIYIISRNGSARKVKID